MPDWFPNGIPADFAEMWASELVFMLLAGWIAGAISLFLTGIRAKKR